METRTLNSIITTICAIVFLFIAHSAFSQQQPAPCSQDSSFRQFDFWIGEWEVKGHDGTVYGKNRIESILDGCVIMENWTGTGVSKGKSFNFYDRHNNQWIQRWVDNAGGNLDLYGEVKAGKAVFRGTSTSSNGKTVHNVLTIKKGAKNEVFQIWEQSQDSISWQKVFDAVYHKVAN